MADIAAALGHSSAFQKLDEATRSAIVRDVNRISSALSANAPARDPYALTLETPADLFARRNQARQGSAVSAAPAEKSNGLASGTAAPTGPDVSATGTIAGRTGALSDEIDFPRFVAGLLHSTFDAIVDASIRQMEAFADLVSAVAKDVDQFTSENVTPNQVRDVLVQKYPGDLQLDLSGSPRLRARSSSEEGEPNSPAWLADYGLEGQPLTDELIEEQLIPAARRQVGENRIKLLATMVLLGMNRVVVRDGTISTKVRFRAVASDKTKVDYAVGQDPGGAAWGQRGSATYHDHSTLVSTVGVNVQADSDLRVELFGEVRINFASETLPLERFANAAQMTLLQRNARWSNQPSNPPAVPPPAEALPTPPPPAQNPGGT